MKIHSVSPDFHSLDWNPPQSGSEGEREGKAIFFRRVHRLANARVLIRDAINSPVKLFRQMAGPEKLGRLSIDPSHQSQTCANFPPPRFPHYFVISRAEQTSAEGTARRIDGREAIWCKGHTEAICEISSCCVPRLHWRTRKSNLILPPMVFRLFVAKKEGSVGEWDRSCTRPVHGSFVLVRIADDPPPSR